MDFRIRNIRNQEGMRRAEQDGLISVLKELTDVMRETNTFLLQNKRQKQQTNQILVQLKSALDQKEKCFNSLGEEIKKISEATCSTLRQVSKILSNASVTERQNSMQTNLMLKPNKQDSEYNQGNYVIEKKANDENLISQIRQISLVPNEGRSVEISMSYPHIERLNLEKRKSQIKSYIAKTGNKIFSISFNMFFREKVDFEKIKAYCSENMLGNFIELVKQQSLTAEEIQMIDNHLSQMVLPYIKVSYPHSEQKETSSMLANLIVEKDIFNQSRFDVINNSPLKKMSWYHLQKQEKNDLNNETSKEIMRLLNYIIQLPNQKINGTQQTIYEQFEEDIKDCFSIAFKKDSSRILRSENKKKTILQSSRQRNFSVKDLCSQIQNMLKSFDSDGNQGQKQKQQTQYSDLVKSYTKIKIGRKISPNCPLFTDSQIDKGALIIKDSSIRRIITKWIESLEQIFYKPVQLTILRNFLLRLDDIHSPENINEGLQDKERLLRQIKKEFKKIEHTIRSIKKNMFENVYECINNRQNQVFDEQFCSNREATVGNICMVLSKASQAYLLKYLTTLVNSLKIVENNYYNSSYQKPQHERKPLLVSLKLGDMMRCQVSSKQKQIVAIYQFLILLCECNPNKFELVRVKNRFNGPNKDILINIWYYQTVMVEIQLAIKSESPFLECSDRYSHFIYELRRDVLGPISQLSSVWNRFSPKSQFFRDKYNFALKKSSFSLRPSLRCTNESHLFVSENKTIFLPFWCSNCKHFQVNQSGVAKCTFCKTRICTMCKNRNQISKKYSNSILIFEINKLKQGMVIKGIDVQSEKQMFYLFLEFMGRLSIYSFQYNEISQIFSALEKKYEEKSSQLENEIYLKQFSEKNIFLVDRPPKIDINLIIQQIFVNFWKNQLKKVSKMKIKTLSFFFSSQPSIPHTTKLKTFKRLLSIDQVAKLVSHIEVLNVQQNSLQSLKELKNFNGLRLLNVNKNFIKNLKELQFLPYIQNLNTVQLNKNQLVDVQDIEKLVNLEKLNLDNNSIKSIKGFKPLDKLKVISLKSNFIESIEAMPSLPSLEKLCLDYNKLETLSGLPQLSKLKQIHLFNNYIESLKGFPLLVSLEKLYLNKNKLKSLEGLPQLNKLKRLQVSRNQIRQINGIPELISLQIIYLEHNLIETLRGFRKQDNLKQLSLCSNKISSLQGTPQLDSLETLDLSFNLLQSLSGLPCLNMLTKLSVSGNSIKALEGTPQLPQLQKLNLDRNSIQSFKGLPIQVNLKQMHAQANSILNLQQLPNFPLLEKLFLGNNKVERLNGIPSLKNLKFFDISQNKISTLEGTPQFPSLEKLNLENNSIESLNGFSGQPNLKQLLLNLNSIRTLKGLPQMKHLQKLNLQKNNIKSLLDLAFQPNLRQLILNQNQIQTLEGVREFTSVQKLFLRSNQIKSFRGFSNFKNIFELDLTKNMVNSFECVPIWLSLQKLDLSDNHLQSMEGFPEQPNLKKLNLIKNRIQNLKGTPNLISLQSFSLGENKLKSLHGLPIMPNLRQLSLYMNQISSLQDCLVAPSLHNLVLAFNRLSSFAGLSSFQNLRTLYVNHNAIASLMDFPLLKSLQNLYLNNNKLSQTESIPHLPNLKTLYFSPGVKISDDQLCLKFPKLSLLNGRGFFCNIYNRNQYPELKFDLFD